MTRQSSLSQRQILLAVIAGATLIILGVAIAGFQQPEASTPSTTVAGSTVQLELNSSQYAPGETVIMTVKNQGRLPISFHVDPPYTISSNGRTTFQPIVAITETNEPLRTLKSGESASWQWDQFTLAGQAKAGKYNATIHYVVQDRSGAIRQPFSIIEQ